MLTPHGEDRRAELLAHAEALFLRKGYADTRMVDIAKAAGVAKGAVYWYFDGKEALLEAIVTRLRDDLRTVQMTATADAINPLHNIYLGTFASVQFVASHLHLYRALWASASASEALVAASRDHIADAAATLLAGQSDGSIRDNDDAAVLSAALGGNVNHHATLLAEGFIADADAAGHTAARFAVHAIANSATHAAHAIEQAEASLAAP